MASDPGKIGSVFDILYADTRRLSSLLSQFSDDGLAVELIRAAEDTSAVQLGLSVKVLSAGTTETGKSATTTRFDPKWLLPLLFLDNAQDLIQHDIAEAAIGSLVLITGRLFVTDLSILKEIWTAPKMREYLISKMTGEEQPEGNRQNRRSQPRGVKKEVTDQEVALELLPLLPHSPQMNIMTADHVIWSTIEAESLTGTVADIMLKHGSKIAGSWSMVGILDARPFEPKEDAEDGDYDDIISTLERIRLGMTMENIWKMAVELGAPARQVLGRPITAYGVTPLIVFREVETASRVRAA